MSRLQQRRRLYRRRQESISKLRAACWLVSVVVLFCFPLLLPATGAYFTDRAELPPAVFRATAFADNLALAPGNSKTNNSPGNPGPAFNVAQTVGGQISLDFGTYPAGNNRNFPAVLVVSNIGDRPLTLNWHFSGDLAPFFAQTGPVTIAPAGKLTLSFKLDTRPEDLPGEYFGTLRLSALDNFITAELPVRLRLAEKQGQQDNKDKDTQEQEDNKDNKADGNKEIDDKDKQEKDNSKNDDKELDIDKDEQDQKENKDDNKDQDKDKQGQGIVEEEQQSKIPAPAVSNEGQSLGGDGNSASGTEGGGDSGKIVEQSPTH